MNVLIDKFLDYRVRRGLSPRTVLANKQDLKLFFRFDDPSKMNRAAVEKRIAEQFATMGNRSVRRRMMSVWVFGKWLEENGFCKNPIHISDTKIKFKKKETRSLTRNEIAVCEKHFADIGPNPNARKIRDLAMYRLMLDAGLRVKEVTDLRPHHLIQLEADGANCFAVKLIARKGKREQELPIPEKTRIAVQRWIDHPDRRDFETGQLFGSWYEPLSTNGLSKLFAKRLKHLGIRDGSAHMLRHTCLTTLRDDGMDVTLIQNYAGHSDITTTMQYLHDTRSQMLRSFVQIQKRPEMGEGREASL